MRLSVPGVDFLPGTLPNLLITLVNPRNHPFGRGTIIGTVNVCRPWSGCVLWPDPLEVESASRDMIITHAAWYCLEQLT
jgi:hypothetical protein